MPRTSSRPPSPYRLQRDGRDCRRRKNPWLLRHETRSRCRYRARRSFRQPGRSLLVVTLLFPLDVFVFVHVMLAIELTHAICVEENQRDEYVYRSLLREPEAKLVPTQRNIIERLDENDSEDKGNDKPYCEAKANQAQVCTPVVSFLRHTSPL